MDIIKTGIGITKTIRNVGRLREIVTVLAKNGFDEFISRGVTSKIPNFVLPKSKVRLKEELAGRREQDWGEVVGSRLRLCFEELGPTFIKLGQLLSSREDIFPPEFINEMRVLQDKVKGLPFSEVEKQINESFEKPWNEIFSELDPKAIGTASIGVVHQGRLHDGTEVVVKVQRPNISKMVETDVSILLFIVSQAEKMSSEIRYLGISRILRDFSISLQNELNFHTEALNAKRIRDNLSKHDETDLFYIPKVYSEYTTNKVLVMEKLKGIPFSDQEKISTHLEDLSEKMELGLKIFIKSFLKDGFFHADLHGGNFFLLENGKIGVIDFGLIGTLGKKGRVNFIAIIYALLTYNYENLVYEFLDVADYDQVPDIDELVADVRDGLSPFIGLTVQQADFSMLMQSVVRTLSRHRLYLPREWFIVFRAFITLDGVGKSLGLDFDIYALMSDDINELIKTAVTKDDLIEEGIWAGRDIMSSIRIFPRHFKWFMREWARRNYAIELVHKGHEGSFKALNGSVQFLGFTIISAVFFAAGIYTLGSPSISSWRDVSSGSWFFWLIGSALFFFGLRRTN